MLLRTMAADDHYTDDNNDTRNPQRRALQVFAFALLPLGKLTPQCLMSLFNWVAVKEVIFKLQFWGNGDMYIYI